MVQIYIYDCEKAIYKFSSIDLSIELRDLNLYLEQKELNSYKYILRMYKLKCVVCLYCVELTSALAVGRDCDRNFAFHWIFSRWVRPAAILYAALPPPLPLPCLVPQLCH